MGHDPLYLHRFMVLLTSLVRWHAAVGAMASPPRLPSSSSGWSGRANAERRHAENYPGAGGHHERRHRLFLDRVLQCEAPKEPL
jgi:hypothetical protein